MFDPGTLWSRVSARRKEAIACGSLHSIPTNLQRIEDAGVRFIVRVLTHLEAKPRHQYLDEQRSDGEQTNPFLPYEQGLFVADVEPHHVCLFNKYNVVEHHLLLITRDFEHQDTLLTHDDFTSLAYCMREFDALGFYNAGVTAGASQTHKHLQLVPLPLAPGVQRLLIQPLLREAQIISRPTSIPAFNFTNALIAVAAGTFHADDPGRVLHELYRKLLERVEIFEAAGRQSAPYNLLLTREWMLLVPRSAENCGGISVNGLGFAGSLFVRNEEELNTLRSLGPMRLLRSVASA